MNLNKVMLIGRLTRDPELRYTPQGKGVASMSLATSRKFKMPDGSDREDTTFVNITVWGKQAESCAAYLKKGRPIYVEGRLTFSKWQGADGQQKSKLFVTAERVLFLGGKPKEPSQATEPEPAPVEPEETPDEPPQEDIPF